MALRASTIRAMHQIAGEEKFPASRLRMWVHQVQSLYDWSLWVRRVDYALIGGDPLILSRRIIQILRTQGHSRPPKIAILHPGTFSGAPLAALEDEAFRRSIGLPANLGLSGNVAPKEVVAMEVARAASFMAVHAGKGVIAFDPVQGVLDEVTGEAVLRIARCWEKPRVLGMRLSTKAVNQIERGDDPLGDDLYVRSERIFRQGMEYLNASMSELMSSPPTGCRFADLIIAKRCEVLSGFVSPPKTHDIGDFKGTFIGEPYHMAGPPPLVVSQAISSWSKDFARVSSDPIL